jgi:hypothetical protein
MLRESGLNFLTADAMDEAAKKVVSAAAKAPLAVRAEARV